MRQLFKKPAINCKKSILFLFAISFINGYSQDFKLAGVQYNSYPTSQIKDDAGNQDISFQEFGAFVNFPTKLKNNKTGLVNGFGYGFVETSLDSELFPIYENKKKLQSFYYQFTLWHQWNEKWNILINLNPTLASDFEAKLNTDDFIFQGAALVTRKINTSFKIGGGIAYSARFGNPRLVPLLNLQYDKNKHQIHALLPLNLTYSYSLLPNKKLGIGVKYTLNGANFNIHTTDTNSINEINYSRANVGVSTDYQLTKMLRLEAYGGLSAARRYTVLDTGDTAYNFDSEAAPFFSIGMVFIPKKNK